MLRVERFSYVRVSFVRQILSQYDFQDNQIRLGKSANAFEYPFGNYCTVVLFDD